MPSAGQKLFCKDFVFSDNSTGEKLLVVLNDCGNKGTCLVLKTTSQEKHYIRSHPGCNSMKKCFYVLMECEQGFDKDTFIQLEHIYPINIEELLDVRQLKFIGRLSDACFKNLKKCLRNFKDDIPVGYWQLIYRQQ